MNFWHLYEHIQSLSTAVAGFKSTMYGYVFMACISNVNGESVLNFYFRHRLWAGLWWPGRFKGYSQQRIFQHLTFY